MAPATEAKAPPARAAVKKLTLTDAVDQWERTTLAMEGLKGLRDEAAKVLLAHAEKTGKRAYKDRIAVVQSGGSVVLDQAKVREYLGAKLSDFQTTTKLGWTLKLLR